MKKSVGALIAVVSIAGAGMVTRTIAPPGQVRAADSPPPAVIKYARWESEVRGGARAERALYTLTTRQAAIGLTGNNRVDSNQSVYYVVLRGHFSDYHVRVPSSVSLPIKGNQIDFTVDVQSGNVLDYGIETTGGPPPLDRLGQVHDFTSDL